MTIEDWSIPNDLRTDPPAPAFAPNLPIPDAPEGLRPIDPQCQAYVRRWAKPSKQPCAAVHDAVARESSPARRDERLVAVAGNCPSNDAIQILRAAAAPAPCAEPLALAILKTRANELDPVLRDVVQAQLLRGRLSRVPQIQTPLYNGVYFDQERLDRWESKVLKVSYARQTAALEALAQSAEPLTGPGGALAWAQVASAWAAVVQTIGSANPRQQWGPNNLTYEPQMSLRGRLSKYEQLAKQSRDRAASRAMGLAADYIDWFEPSLFASGAWARYGANYWGRSLRESLRLVGLDLRPKAAIQPLRALTFAPWFVPLLGESPSPRDATEPLLDPAVGVRASALDATQRLDVVRARIGMAVLLDSPLQTDRALALLSELSPAERTDEGHLLWALARALRPPYATNRQRDVAALQSIANGRGPWAPHARFFVALFCAEHAGAELVAVYDGEHPETLLPHRQKLDTLKAACSALVSTAGELGPDRVEHLRDVIVNCQDILHWFGSAFEAGASMQH